MAFTEEQERNISETIARMAAYMDAQDKARADADAKAKAEAAAKEQEKPATLLDTAKEQVKTDAANAGNQSAIESALGFNMKIGDFAEKYKKVPKGKLITNNNLRILLYLSANCTKSFCNVVNIGCITGVTTFVT